MKPTRYLAIAVVIFGLFALAFGHPTAGSSNGYPNVQHSANTGDQFGVNKIGADVKDVPSGQFAGEFLNFPNSNSVSDLITGIALESKAIQRNDKEIASLVAKPEDKNNRIPKLQRQMKELQARTEELEEKHEIERQAGAKATMEQISEGGRNIHELKKPRNRIQIEGEELQVALEEAEFLLEQEENSLHVQLKLSKVSMRV